MNYIDVIIIVAGIIAFILGFKDGFVRKLIGSIGFFLAIFLAFKFSSHLGQVLDNVFGFEKYFADIAGGFLIFLVTILITSIIKRVVHPFDKVNNLINRIVGGVVGFIQIIFFLSAVFFLLNIFKFPSENAKAKSFLYSYVYEIMPKTFDVLSGYTPDAKDSIKNYILEKDSL